MTVPFDYVGRPTQYRLHLHREGDRSVAIEEAKVERSAKLADMFETHWRGGTVIDALPSDLEPHSADDVRDAHRAYLLRHASGGWKVGPGVGGGLSAAPLRGQANQWTEDVVRRSSVRMELEVAVVLGEHLAADPCPADVLAAIRGVHLAIELLETRFSNRDTQSRYAIHADHLNNSGVILGSGSALAAVADLGSERLELTVNGSSVGTAHAPALTDVIASLVWLAGYAMACDAPLTPGAIVITGARIGPQKLDTPGLYVGRSQFGEVSVRK